MEYKNREQYKHLMRVLAVAAIVILECAVFSVFWNRYYASHLWLEPFWDKLEAHNAWGDVSPTFGFNWDSTEHSTELTALSNALNNYRAALETGSVGAAKVDDTLDSLNKALYDAGLQDVMDEKQAQLDKWLEEK